MSETTTLGDAIAAGYSQLSGWTRFSAYRPDSDTACAIGLALVGVVGRDYVEDYVQSNGSITRWNVAKLLGPEVAREGHRIADLNNLCGSYEEVMLKLKERGYTEIEVTGAVRGERR